MKCCSLFVPICVSKASQVSTLASQHRVPHFILNSEELVSDDTFYILSASLVVLAVPLLRQLLMVRCFIRTTL